MKYLLFIPLLTGCSLLKQEPEPPTLFEVKRLCEGKVEGYNYSDKHQSFNINCREMKL